MSGNNGKSGQSAYKVVIVIGLIIAVALLFGAGSVFLDCMAQGKWL